MRHHTLTALALAALCAIALSGCSAPAYRGSPSASAEMRDQATDGDSAAAAAYGEGAEQTGGAEWSPSPAGRMFIWTADLRVEVMDLEASVQEAIALAEGQGGHVNTQRDLGESAVYLSIRIPATVLREGLTAFEALGKVRRRNVQGVDVTDQMVDISARLKTKIALRDRLTEHLDKAINVSDIIAIETELGRIQADIESMEARLRTLSGQVEYATVTLTLERASILGPLGYALKHLGLGIRKLFIIRD